MGVTQHLRAVSLPSYQSYPFFDSIYEPSRLPKYGSYIRAVRARRQIKEPIRTSGGFTRSSPRITSEYPPALVSSISTSAHGVRNKRIWTNEIVAELGFVPVL